MVVVQLNVQQVVHANSSSLFLGEVVPGRDGVAFCWVTATRGIQHVIVFLPSVSVGSPPDRQEYLNNPIHRTLVPRHMQVSDELLHVHPRLFCGTDDASGGLDLQVVVDPPYGFVCFSAEKIAFPIMCKEAPLSTLYILSFDFMIGFGLGYIRLYVWRVTL